MLDVMIQNLSLDAFLPHVDTTTYQHVYKHLYKLPHGMGFPLFVLVGLIIWFAFLALIGAFKK